MHVARDRELTLRLMTLIEVLTEANTSCPEPPDCAATDWTEAAVRAWFDSGGAAAPPAEEEAAAAQADAAAPPPSARVLAARARLTAAEYRAAALAHGLPPRGPAALIPAGCPVWAAVLAQGHRPFTKHLVGEGGLRPADGWPAGAHALAHGFDLRLAYCEATGRLAAAVRYSERASIGAGMGYSVHGGAVETAFDEATAELVKVTHAASAATLELAVALRRPVPVGQTLRLDAWLCDGAGGGGGGKDPGLRVRTEAALRDGRGALLATCTATLVDVNLLARMSQPGA